MPSAASVPARLQWWGSDRSSCTAAAAQGTCHTRQRTAARASDRSSPLGAAGDRRTCSSQTAAAGGPEKSRREDTAKERWRRERTLFGTCKGIGKGFDRQRHWRKAFEDLQSDDFHTKSIYRPECGNCGGDGSGGSTECSGNTSSGDPSGHRVPCTGSTGERGKYKALSPASRSANGSTLLSYGKTVHSWGRYISPSCCLNRPPCTENSGAIDNQS